MKYNEEQKELIKTYKIDMFSKRRKANPKIEIKDGFYIIESKINKQL